MKSILVCLVAALCVAAVYGTEYGRDEAIIVDGDDGVKYLMVKSGGVYIEADSGASSEPLQEGQVDREACITVDCGLKGRFLIRDDGAVFKEKSSGMQQRYADVVRIPGVAYSTMASAAAPRDPAQVQPIYKMAGVVPVGGRAATNGDSFRSMLEEYYNAASSSVGKNVLTTVGQIVGVGRQIGKSNPDQPRFAPLYHTTRVQKVLSNASTYGRSAARTVKQGAKKAAQKLAQKAKKVMAKLQKLQNKERNLADRVQGTTAKIVNAEQVAKTAAERAEKAANTALKIASKTQETTKLLIQKAVQRSTKAAQEASAAARKAAITVTKKALAEARKAARKAARAAVGLKNQAGAKVAGKAKVDSLKAQCKRLFKAEAAKLGLKVNKLSSKAKRLTKKARALRRKATKAAKKAWKAKGKKAQAARLKAQKLQAKASRTWRKARNLQAKSNAIRSGVKKVKQIVNKRLSAAKSSKDIKATIKAMKKATKAAAAGQLSVKPEFKPTPQERIIPTIQNREQAKKPKKSGEFDNMLPQDVDQITVSRLLAIENAIKGNVDDEKVIKKGTEFANKAYGTQVSVRKAMKATCNSPMCQRKKKN